MSWFFIINLVIDIKYVFLNIKLIFSFPFHVAFNHIIIVILVWSWIQMVFFLFDRYFIHELLASSVTSFTVLFKHLFCHGLLSLAIFAFYPQLKEIFGIVQHWKNVLSF